MRSQHGIRVTDRGRRLSYGGTVLVDRLTRAGLLLHGDIASS